MAKCGEIVSWHWAHISKDCDPWSEPESEWHRGWKQLFPAQMQEVVVGAHRADVLTNRGVIEFQHSTISPQEIKERESFYGKMVWVVDARSFNFEWDREAYIKRFTQKNRSSLFDLLQKQEQPRQTVESFIENEDAERPCWRWLWPRKSWMFAQKAIIFDRGDGNLLLVKTFNWHRGCSFQFLRISRERFVDSCLRQQRIGLPSGREQVLQHGAFR